jgi:putative nucleotidyltransferase with HDIG domain
VLVTCAVLLVAGAAALAVAVPRNVHAHALSTERSDLVAFAQTSVIPAAVTGSRLRAHPSAAGIRRAIADNPGVRRVLIWRPSGRLAWTSGRRAAGSSAKPSSSVTEARLTGRTTVATSDGLLTVSIPVRRAERTVAVVAVTANARPIDALVADTRRTVAMTAAVVFGGVLIGVLTLVSVLGWRLRHQAGELTERAAELTESYRELEQTSLDAIETLNATVEAKDPYTAGHSQRVRRISLAIGRELQLPPKRLGMLAQAALFHDIGKIGVPDAILTKPARLTAAEYEVMKRHASEGADILARLSRLHEAVPAVRHHHEHWDGCGYPDGLREEEIPLEASIIGLADAWDAMTTTRPYATARSPHEAMAELERASGSQFNPAVVTAFLEAARRHPQEIMPPDQPPILVAVG